MAASLPVGQEKRKEQQYGDIAPQTFHDRRKKERKKKNEGKISRLRNLHRGEVPKGGKRQLSPRHPLHPVTHKRINGEEGKRKKERRKGKEMGPQIVCYRELLKKKERENHPCCRRRLPERKRKEREGEGGKEDSCK